VFREYVSLKPNLTQGLIGSDFTVFTYGRIIKLDPSKQLIFIYPQFGYNPKPSNPIETRYIKRERMVGMLY